MQQTHNQLLSPALVVFGWCAIWSSRRIQLTTNTVFESENALIEKRLFLWCMTSLGRAKKQAKVFEMKLSQVVSELCFH